MLGKTVCYNYIHKLVKQHCICTLQFTDICKNGASLRSCHTYTVEGTLETSSAINYLLILETEG